MTVHLDEPFDSAAGLHRQTDAGRALGTGRAGLRGCRLGSAELGAGVAVGAGVEPPLHAASNSMSSATMHAPGPLVILPPSPTAGEYRAKLTRHFDRDPAAS
jgi:hypothetical protein